MNVPNLAVKRFYCACIDPDDDREIDDINEYIDQREHVGFICSCKERLVVHVPYDSGVVFQPIDLEVLLKALEPCLGLTSDWSLDDVIQSLRKRTKQ